MTSLRSTVAGKDSRTAFLAAQTSILPADYADRSPLYRTFHAALGNRATGPVDIVAIGDSTTSGAQASTLNKRWLALLRDQLRTWFQPAGVTGGDGYVQMNATYNSPWTLTGTTIPGTPAGLGQGAVNMATTATASMTFTGTAVDVFYTKQSGGGTFSVSIDGGAATNINTSNASEVNGVAQRFGSLSVGSHTIALAVISGTSMVEGVMVYNGDETKGIRVWDGGRSGITSAGYTSNTKYLGAVTTIQPSLVVIFLGINDYRTGTSIANTGSQLVTIATATRAACTIPPTVLLVAPYLPIVGAGTLPFLRYYDQVYIAAQRLADVDLVDLYWKFGPAVQTNALALLNADLTHPSDKGYQFIADAFAGRIRPGGA